MRYNTQTRSWPTPRLVWSQVFTPSFSPATNVAHNLSDPAWQGEIERYTPNSGGGRTVWKDFEHYKLVNQPVSIPFGVRAYGLFGTGWPQYYQTNVIHPHWPYPNSGAFGDACRLNSGLPALFNVSRVSDGGFVPPPVDLESLKARSLKSMLPIIKAEMSLINNLIELKDFRTLPRTLRRLRDFVPKGRKTLRRILGLASDAYLQEEFNIRPLLRDVINTYVNLKRCEKRMNDLISRQGMPQVKHFQLNFEEMIPFYSDQVGPYAAVDIVDHNVRSYLYYREVRSWATKFHAQIEYNYYFYQYQLVHARALALLDYFGVNLNPAIIWNAIPWSFVVDWVLGVSRWLNQFTEESMKPLINIRRYLWSVTRKREMFVTRRISHITSNPDITDGPTCPMPTVIETAYRRNTGLPSMSSIESSGLSAKEVSLGAALVFARKRRPRTH